ncbi:hypothetical protein EU508_08490 [Pseudoalteromonas fuliginea]|uniref:LemA family protein n=1 Tax=Pseudoalteromonas fuliginea TaxID=1872678 RepID=A0AB73BHQ4_9GAMM|nr:MULTISPECIES: hypothetical protein [Pseudoalteromonas]ALQ08534.1 hypothetical protein D172_010920 [Pseudoalteromonas sp. Bsw20308]KAA1161041.1 hypothetical protein EU508_08490 [Pseudoalteromonas fuliginea]
MTYVVFFSLLLLITLLGSYLIVENNRRIASETKKRIFNDRVSKISTRLKSKLNELLDVKVIRPKHVPRVQAIVSNFFVVQAHNDDNLQKLEDVTDLLVSTLSNELNKTYQTNSAKSLIDNLQHFIAELPHQGILYNKAFYDTELPSLIFTIQTEDIHQRIDKKEEVEFLQQKTNDSPINEEASVA